ncbi:hypothetical protein [Gorillibacterium sp. sgz5001074]|uniref:hypothetical protein n=1 Tax=Gorillibacterium sp. sgz5001074 TaxID=3446695 RepID=UPI003F66E664
MILIRRTRPVLLAAGAAAALLLASCDNSPAEAPGHTQEAYTTPSPAAIGTPPALTGAALAPAPMAGTAAPAPSATSEERVQESRLRQDYARLSADLSRVDWPAPAAPKEPVVLHAKLGRAPSLESESFYSELLKLTSMTLTGRAFRLEDDSLGTVIEASGSAELLPDAAKVNGTVNAFHKMSLERYAYLPPLPAPEPGPLVAGLSESAWSWDALERLAGPHDTFFNDAYVYDKSRVYAGIRVQNRQLSRLVFRPDYPEPVAGGLRTTSTRAQITERLGQPPFESRDEQLFGYKLEPYYLFFGGEDGAYEICLYPRDAKRQAAEGETLAGILRNLQEKQILNPDALIQELQLKWPDYDYSYYGRGSHEVDYYTRGLRIPYVDTPFERPYIEIYGGFEGPLAEGIFLPVGDSGKGPLHALDDSPLIRFRLHEDLAFEAEKHRLRQSRTIRDKVRTQGVPSPDGKQVVLENEGYVFEAAGFFLVHPDGDRPNLELRTGYFTSGFTWLNNRYFVYEVGTDGILAYDTERKAVIPVDQDPDHPFQRHLLRVDTGRSRIVYTVGDKELEKAYAFGKDGSLIFPDAE